MNCVIKQMLLYFGICGVIIIVMSVVLVVLEYLIGDYTIVLLILSLSVLIYLIAKESCKYTH